MEATERLKLLKQKSGLSDRDLADLIGISRTTMYKRMKEGFRPMEALYIQHLFQDYDHTEEE